MLLRAGGIDVFYIDESHDQENYVVTAVTVPMLRQVEGAWHIIWPDYFELGKQWRANIHRAWKIPMSKELHAQKLLSGRGNLLYGKYPMLREVGAATYQGIMSSLSFLPAESIFSVAVTRQAKLYDKTRLEAAMCGLFQRMRNQCISRKTNAMVFFDEGHPEYRQLYRRAQKNLPTGSSMGSWGDGATTNSLPLNMFFKDGNEKISKHCLFTQIADLVAFAAFMKIKDETNTLEPWQKVLKAGKLYDFLPIASINRKVQRRAPADGIVRLGF